MSKPKTDRNKEIAEAKRKGVTYRELAIKYGVSEDRIYQIVKKYD